MRSKPVVAARLICTSDDGHATPLFPRYAQFPWAEPPHYRPLAGPILPDHVQHPRERHDPPLTDGQNKRAIGGTMERHPELPRNTVSCELPEPFALVSWRERGW